MKAHRSRFSYPVFLDLDEVPVLVIGGGRIGWRKAEGLLDAGAIVRLVGADISAHVDVERITAAGGEVITATFDDGHLDGQRLVVTATGDLTTDAAISDAARARSIWTNAADQPVECEFILPAITRAGRVTAAISTDGASPALAGYVRDRVAEILEAGVAEIADTLATERAAVQAAGGSTEDIDWRPRLDELFAQHADVLTGTANR
jgi:precorrin-2 dehydrogenase/sirohydrochlorin ferrochelatase